MYVKQKGLLKFNTRALFGNTSYLYLVLALLNVIGTLFLFNSGEYAAFSLLGILFTIICISLMLNIQGADIDLNRRKIIVYKKIVGLRVENIVNLSDYKKIVISKERFVHYTEENSSNEVDVDYYFFLSLKDEKGTKNITLAESQNYKKMVTEGQQLSLDLKFDIKNEVKEYVEKIKEKRQLYQPKRSRF